MAVYLSVTNLHVTSITSLSLIYLRIALHSKRLHAAPYFRQEIWQRFSLQLTSTSPPPQVCLEFTFALLLTANAFTLRLIFVKRYGSASLQQLTITSPPSQVCLEFTFALHLTETYTRCALFLSRDMAAFLSTTYLHAASITSVS